MFFYSLNCFGQNIVQNPNFEQYSNCPNFWNQMSYCQFWSSYRETPDYYNTCSTLPAITPPNCYEGFQYPHSGNAYAGFYTLAKSPQNNKEFIGSQLLSTLTIGQKYYITFYVNRGGQNQAVIASNKIGVKFSTIPYSDTNPAPINNISHFYTDSIITDTVKWSKISGSFIADSAYSYIIIGNFFDDSNTDTITYSIGSIDVAYYYLDDICVSTDSLYCENWLGIKEQSANNNKITMYPNPCTNELNVKYNNVPNENTTLSIINIFGRIVIQTKTKETEFTFNTGKLAKGLYLVKVETGSKVELQKVTKE